MMTNGETEIRESKLMTLIIISGLIVTLWIASILIMNEVFSDSTIKGSFGDSFGAINSLFSGLAFAGIIYTILLQRQELKLQRLELRQTREELKRSADAQDKSQKALTKQIESMDISAKLNCYSTLLEYYNLKAINAPNGIEKDIAKKMAYDNIEEIHNVLKDIDGIIESETS